MTRAACRSEPKSRGGATRERSFSGIPVAIAIAIAIATATGVTGCASTAGREGLDVAQLPVDVRADYALFARRCSKCHSLARALNSGIADDSAWVDYVNRMRRQPGSGITPQDTAPILRFLHYYSLEQQHRKRTRDTPGQARMAPPTNATVISGRDQHPNQ